MTNRVKLLKDFLWLQERRGDSVLMHAHACVHVYTHVLEGGGDKDTSIFTAVQPESSMAMDASKES